MSHDALRQVLEVQSLNATLAGTDLRAAAAALIGLLAERHAVAMAFDPAGERILGAALATSERPIEVFDYTAGFEPGSQCLLVGGAIAGPVGVSAAAAAALAAGAVEVDAALLGGWHEPIDNVHAVLSLIEVYARVA